MRKIIILLFAVMPILSSCGQKKTAEVNNGDFTKYVNPFMGTSFTGHTFPGATFPLGIIQAGPETGNFTWEYCPGYVYEDSTINGFSQTRLNGTGCIDLGDILVQPFSGVGKTDFGSKYDKSSEKASPGYYAVHLTDNEVNVEITATPHVAFHKYKFEKGKPANVLVDFQSGLVWGEKALYTHILENDTKIENEYTISGYTRRSCWVNRSFYYVVVFDKPIAKEELLPKRDEKEKAPRYVLSFDLKEGEELNMKISLSLTSVEGAKANMTAEVSDWDFNKAKQSASDEWNKYLSRIKIDGSDNDKIVFYSALYHLFIQPNNIADVDGKYVGPNRSVSKSTGNKFYSTLSQWDTFRAAFPLYTVISPEIVPDMVNSMLDYSEQQGHLPIWTLWGQETYTMIGNHSVPMIADAYLKGFKGFDAERAFAEIKKSLTSSTHPKSDWNLYDKYGYYPYDLIEKESVSRTLECGFDDYCTALMAKKMGKKSDYDFFIKRSDFYKNLFDAETISMRPKDSKGNWLSPFDPYELAHADSQVGGHYTEGNACQYTWHVLQDIPGLIEMMGGKEAAGTYLDSLFYTTKSTTGTLSDVTGLIGQYAHGNEPSHHVAYIYPLLDRADEAQKLIRRICSDYYKPEAAGLIGNDDCGQMSAWYIFSAMGFYPMNPVSGEFIIGAPQIPKASIMLENGKTFTMEAKNLSKENMFVEKIELNRKPYDKKYITYNDIMSGANLVFYMTNKPVK